MSLTKNPGRVAGLLYLVTVITGPFTLMYVPRVLFVPGNAAATADNIAAHETLFSLGVAIDLFAGVLWIAIILALYRLLRGVNQNYAVLMAVLGGVMVTIINFLITLNNTAVLVLVRGEEFVALLDKPQRDALVLLFLRLHRQGVLAAEIYWGLWLFPLAILVYRSRFLPRFLGLWLALNGAAYLAMSLTGLLMPQYDKWVSNLTFPALFGELALMLWLVVRGVDQETVDAYRADGTARAVVET